MSYEEKVINGVLMRRATPDDVWWQCSDEMMGEKILELQNTIIDLKACLRTCASSAQSGLVKIDTLEAAKQNG